MLELIIAKEGLLGDIKDIKALRFNVLGGI
jgi:hypothetical protein